MATGGEGTVLPSRSIPVRVAVALVGWGARELAVGGQKEGRRKEFKIQAGRSQTLNSCNPEQ